MSLGSGPSTFWYRAGRVQLTFWNGPCVGRLRFHERILLRQMTMPRISYCIEINCASAIKGVIRGVDSHKPFHHFPAKPMCRSWCRWIQTGPGGVLLRWKCCIRGMKTRSIAGLTHAQREQVEQITAAEAPQLQMTRGNPNLSGAQVFRKEQEIRIQASSKSCEN